MPLDGTFGAESGSGGGHGRCPSQRPYGWTSADLNYLFYRQQIERSRAGLAASPAARNAHCGLARLYEQAIEQVTSGKIRFPAPLACLGRA